MAEGTSQDDGGRGVDKYVVFKREDLGTFEGQVIGWEDKAIKDAIVLRKQDRFTPAAMYAYAMTARNLYEVLVTLLDADDLLVVDVDKAASWGMNQAEAAEQSNERKVPDQ